MKKAANLVMFAWAISVLSVLIAFIAWGDTLSWRLNSLGTSTYTIFPLFGLVAFSLMWSHYIVAAARKYANYPSEVTKQYFNITSLLVLIAIFLHPGLLIWQLWRDGMGLPPQSYLNFVDPARKAFVVLGSVSLLVFIAYEFRRKFNKKTWWKFVQYASDGAMIAIFIHGLKLGGNLQAGWYKYVWYFYGLSLVASLLYLYWPKQKTAAS